MDPIDKIIENFRKSEGLERIHVSLGPAATPEGVEKELQKVKSARLAYSKIPEEVKLKARISFLESRLKEICQMCRISAKDFLNETNELSTFRMKIFQKSEIIGIDMDHAIKFANQAELSD